MLSRPVWQECMRMCATYDACNTNWAHLSPFHTESDATVKISMPCSHCSHKCEKSIERYKVNVIVASLAIDASLSVTVKRASAHVEEIYMYVCKMCVRFPDETVRWYSVRRTGDRTSKYMYIPGMYCIPGNWPIRILLWYANFEALFSLILQNCELK